MSLFKQKEKKPSGIKASQKLKGLLDTSYACLGKYSYLGCAFIIPILIFWMVYIVFEVYPFGDESVLVLDLNGQYVYFFEALRNALHGETSLIYSWSRSLGGEFIGIYAYYIASPLSYLVFFFSENHITEALLTIILLKTGISGATMAFYMKKTRPAAKELAVIIFSTMYALSAYMIAYAHNTMWIDAMMLLPLVIYGLEKLVDEQKFKLYVVTLTLTLVSTFYIGYMVCFFILIYFIYYYCVFGSQRKNNFYGEKLHLLKSLARIGAASAVSILIACFIILPTYYSLTFGKTTFTDASWEFVTQFDLLDFFTKMLPGSYDTVRPEGLPFIYCGVLAVIMIPLYFAAKKIPIREKIGAASILAVMIFCMNSKVIDTFLHGMQRPNWLNYRYSFTFIFLVIVFACRGFEMLQTIKPSYLCAVGAGIIGLVLVIQKTGYEYIDDYLCIWVTIVCVVAYLVTLRFLIVKNMNNIALTVLSVLVCVELFGASVMTSVSLDEDVGMSSRRGYVEFFDRVRGIVESVQESDKSFYRMEKTYRRSVCDDLALNIKGISCSTSTLNASVIDFLDRMGYSSSSHWSEYGGGTMVSDSLLGMKYLISESSQMSELLTPYLSDEENELYAYFNEYALSMGYSADEMIEKLDLTLYDSPFDVMNELVTALTGSNETVQLFKHIEHELSLENAYISYSGNVYETQIVDGEEVKVSIPYLFYKPKSDTSPGRLLYSYTIDETLDNADVYFFFCSNYPREVSWMTRIDGTEVTGSFFGGDSDCIQNLGVLKGGTTYHLQVTMNEEDNVFYVKKNAPVFYYLDHEVFKEVFTELARGCWNIDDDYTSTHLKGTVTVPEGDSVMFTSIPYDKGWNVYLDGEKVNVYKTCDTLLAFDITEGEHTIEMKYCSKAMSYGFVLSLFGIAGFAAMLLLDRFLFAPRRRGKHEAWLVRLDEIESEKQMHASANALADVIVLSETASEDKKDEQVN